MQIKKVILIISALFFVLTTIYAEHVDITKARLVAKNVYFERASDFEEVNYNDIVFSSETATYHKQTPLYYIFNVANQGGYVIISADDHAYPVLAYGLGGNYIESEFPPAFFELMESYKLQMIEIIEEKLPSTSEIDAVWNAYLSDPFQKGTLSTVGPLLSTNWDQSPYYNDSCPGGSVTGCVATAMAQVMKYWAHPHKGKGSHTYSSNYGMLSVDFSKATYNYNNMPDVVNSPNADVAKLMYHCGVSVNMNYSPYGSGASMSDARLAMVQYFKYSNNTLDQWKTSFNNIYWEILLRADLINKRPLLYAGGSHAFVCDGFQYPNHFHFNFGWGGMADGYFYITNINPSGGNFTSQQIAITDCYPDPTLSNFVSQAETTGEENIDLVYAGIEDIPLSDAVQLFPNPCDGNFNLKIINNFKGDIVISIKDLSGKTIEKTVLHKNQHVFSEDIQLSDFPSGLYLLSASTDNEQVIKKFSIR